MFERYKIKKLLKPRKEFTEKTKTAFLAVFDVAHPVGTAAASARATQNRFGIFAKTAIAFAAILAIFASASVYADTANVAADSPLYPLKRLDESVQLAVAPVPEKAQLQATFAARRANEIADLEARTPSSTQIASLSSDLNAALDSSLNDAQSANLSDGQLKTFCDKVLTALATGTHPIIVHRFAVQCGASVGVGIGVGASANVNASGTVSASATMPNLIASSGIQLYRIGTGFGVGANGAGVVSSTILATPTSSVPLRRLLRGAIINDVINGTASSSLNILRLHRINL
jgi:hypothetical protein